MTPARHRRRAAAVVAVLVTAVLALTACGDGAQNSSVPPLVVDPAPAVATTGATPSEGSAVSGYDLSIARIAATSSLVPLGLNADRTVEVPPISEPMQAGLYTNGPVPGDPGPAVILGHINGGGRPGIFARLAELTTGDDVDVTRPDGRTATFRVYRTTTVPKDVFPTSAVYSDTPGSELRLITCGGDLDRAARSYLSNVIVFASLVGVR